MEILSRPEFLIAALVLIVGAAAVWQLHSWVSGGFGRSSPQSPAPAAALRPPFQTEPSPPGAAPRLAPVSGGAPVWPAASRPAEALAPAASRPSTQGPGGEEHPPRARTSPIRPVERPSVTFADVAGLEEAIIDLREVKEYLANPSRFRALGANLPAGILLYGPPGNGKTLLARALAGEADVPFYLVSAASFVEQYVGVGAARIRELFEEARRHAPAIVFIDELDAVGRRRNGGHGGDREYDHTLNQLLVELDGAVGSSGVLILGATNRPELLDPALVRPGRFDRRIGIDPPDLRGREAILRLHASRRPFEPGVDWHEVATQTAGLSAAELANLVNEASLLAARRARRAIAPEDVGEAVSRALTGPRSSRVLSGKEKRMIAYHEAGHALLSLLLRGAAQPTRVSIVGRGNSMGRSPWSLPIDGNVLTERQLLSQLIVLLGGRVAEVHAFGEPSTRAEDDLEEAAALARRMVGRWGMTVSGGSIGPNDLAFGHDHVLPGLGAGDLLAKGERAARALIQEHGERLDAIAELLVAHETLTLLQIGSLAGIDAAELDPREFAAA